MPHHHGKKNYCANSIKFTTVMRYMLHCMIKMLQNTNKEMPKEFFSFNLINVIP
jgi:hypothetical protein